MKQHPRLDATGRRQILYERPRSAVMLGGGGDDGVGDGEPGNGV